MKKYLLVCSLMLVFAEAQSTLTRSGVAADENRFSRLRLTSFIISQRFCGTKLGEPTSLEIELGLHYTNVGTTTLILYNGIHPVIRQTVSRTAEDISASRFLVEASNLVVTSNSSTIGEGSLPYSMFVTLQPNASFDTKTQVVISLKSRDRQSGRNLNPGDYFLQVTVRTWPEPQAQAEKMSAVWSRKGALWYKNTTSEPVRFAMTEKPPTEDCSSLADLLIASRNDPNATDESGNTGLIAALFEDASDIFLQLLQNGADVNAKTKTGLTALIVAAGRGDSDAVAELVRRGADPNARTDEGETALLQAVRRCDPELLEILIAAGAQVNSRNKDGKSALSLAESCPFIDRLELVRILEKAGAK